MNQICYPYFLGRGTEPVSNFVLRDSSRSYKKGPTENWIKVKLFLLGVRFLRDDVSVIIDGHKYEPDLAYVDREKGIYIDIEIDEPYTWNKKPCHYIDQQGLSTDKNRDNRFVSSGWTVVRFSEKQIFLETKSCIGYLSRVIASLDDSFTKKHSNMTAWGNPTEDPRWNYNQSIKMSGEDARGQYLGFKPGKVNAKEIFDFSIHEIRSIMSGRWLK